MQPRTNIPRVRNADVRWSISYMGRGRRRAGHRSEPRGRRVSVDTGRRGRRMDVRGKMLWRLRLLEAACEAIPNHRRVGWGVARGRTVTHGVAKHHLLIRFLSQINNRHHVVRVHVVCAPNAIGIVPIRAGNTFLRIITATTTIIVTTIAVVIVMRIIGWIIHIVTGELH
jgi:hypothetical protein